MSALQPAREDERLTWTSAGLVQVQVRVRVQELEEVRRDVQGQTLLSVQEQVLLAAQLAHLLDSCDPAARWRLAAQEQLDAEQRLRELPGESWRRSS